ncbi:MAG: hypothetical protein JSW54_12335 [Fidelibacterota bacterium]|nr:MAG: hypothetical protein JSW54_12335 [Candidatus Neomarinimicrobiota bacterium]
MRPASLVLLLMLSIAAGANSETPEKAVSYDFEVSSYDLSYEIDAVNKVFKSTQEIGIINVSENKVNRIYFLLHPDLLIDDIDVLDSKGKTLRVRDWELLETQQIYLNTLQIVQVRTSKRIAPGREYRFRLEYHMRPEAFKDNVGQEDHVLDLTLSTESSYAIGPTTGHNAVFNRNNVAPFRFTITYPEGNSCCAPGSLLSSERKGGYVVETYESNVPNIPTFSCAPYAKELREIGDLTLEYYVYPGQPLMDEIVAVTAQIIQLYTTSFGELETKTYRFGTVGARHSTNPFWENKGNAIYHTDEDMFIGLVAHELFHNWNVFSVNWSGKLYNWFEEGGANFIGNWACEQLVGKDFSAMGRIYFTSAYDGSQGPRGYNAVETLETAYKNKAGSPELMLIYYYGALVWEQLRQKVGDEALFAGLGDFFAEYRYRTATYQDLIRCLESKTDVQVEVYLNQWIKNNAMIDLAISDVNVQAVNESYTSEVEIVVASDQDYELFTAIGYRTPLQKDLSIIDLHTTEQGSLKVTFESSERPVFIQVDPACRVPQINLDNNIWQE